MGISKNQAFRWQQVASVPDPEFEQHIAETKAAGEELTTAGVLRLSTAPHVSHNSGDNEWYTPADYASTGQ